FFLPRSAPHLHLHSFPTRRSSDLLCRRALLGIAGGLVVVPAAVVVGVELRTGVKGKPEHHGPVEGVQRWSVQGPLNVFTRPHRRSEEHTSELQSRENLVCRLLLEK